MFARVIVVAAFGLLVGAGAGALTLGWDASMAVGSSILGPTRDWWPLAAAAGAAGGAVFGLALGLYVGLARAETPHSVLLGCAVGAVGAAAIMYCGEGIPYWRLRSAASRFGPLALSLAAWALIGLLLGAANKLLDAGRG